MLEYFFVTNEKKVFSDCVFSIPCTFIFKRHSLKIICFANHQMTGNPLTMYGQSVLNRIL